MSPFMRHEASDNPIVFIDGKPHIVALGGGEALEVVPETELQLRSDYVLRTREGQRDRVMLHGQRVCFAHVVEPKKEVLDEQTE